MKTSFLTVKVLLPIFVIFFTGCREKHAESTPGGETEMLWRGWNKYQIRPEDSLVRYGHALLENTSYYLGPKGIVAQLTNGMNCQNCHLEGGTVPWGNNWGGVFSTYPKLRNRSGSIETIPKRVADCMERSLNGTAIDSNSREMKAIIAYMKWLGEGVPKGHKPAGTGIEELPYLDRAADPEKGRLVFISKCQRCHGEEGLGQLNPEGTSYIYPPLWGPYSYNCSAGLYRLSRFAGFVRNNMPFEEADYQHPQLSIDESWDVAAFVNSRPRPMKLFREDWPDISKKPIDHPFGPYADTFSEQQHKYGPFGPIRKAREEMNSKKAAP